MESKISIIVPYYNESYEQMKKCLLSVVDQTYSNIELIIVDDGSDNNNLNKLISELKLDNAIVIKNKINQGVSTVRNKGLDRATGDYVFFLDSDDYIESNTIEELVKTAVQEKADIVETPMILHYKNNNKNYVFSEMPPVKVNVNLGNIYNNKDAIKWRYTTGLLINSKLVKDLRFNESLIRYEDGVFVVKLKETSKKHVLIKDGGYHYKKRSDQRSENGENQIHYLAAAKEILETVDKYDIDDKSKKTVEKILVSNMVLIILAKLYTPEMDKEELKVMVSKFIDQIKIINPKLKYLEILNNEKVANVIFKLIYKINLNDKVFKLQALTNKRKK